MAVHRARWTLTISAVCLILVSGAQRSSASVPRNFFRAEGGESWQQRQLLDTDAAAKPGGQHLGGKYTCMGMDLSEHQVEEQLKRRCRMLCESGDGAACNAAVETCMGNTRKRLQRRTMEEVSGAEALGVGATQRRLKDADQHSVQIALEDITFVVFFAVGKRNAEAYPSHQFVQPDMNFLPVLRRTHPGSRVVMLSDEHTPLAPDLGIEIYRVAMDSERLGRNAYANYYQYLGQKQFLKELKQNGSSSHVVFMDMDVLVIESMLELFCSQFSYGLTINANEFDPVDIGVQAVHSSSYDEAIAFLQDLTDNYLDLIGHPNSFTTGQVVMRNTLEMGHKDPLIPRIAAAASKNGIHCRSVQGGKHKICFFSCLKYNYWEDCTDAVGTLLPQSAELMTHHGVKIMQFVAWRKPGLKVVADAFLSGGIQQAYEAFASLPHTEAEYDKLFAYNKEVTKICYGDDKGCSGVKDENEQQLWQYRGWTDWAARLKASRAAEETQA